jgi:hypothetical protein
MEVHAHSHTERKKFSHYFWEFFMLFLAVTLGYFVENMREHLLDRQKEKQYILSLVRDLQDDTARLRALQNKFATANRMTDTLIRLLKSNERNLESCKIYNLARKIPFSYGAIEPKDETFQQLKSSGNLRLIHNTQIVDDIGSYYQRYVSLNNGGPGQMLFQNRHDVYLFTPKLFDMLVLDKMFSSDSLYYQFRNLDSCEEKPILLSNDPVIINKVCGRYFYLRMSAGAIMNWITGKGEMLSRANSLLTTIKKEYHLK